ncbi:MAG: primosomal protein N' [Candidatus Sericytochromatia bacterium]
MNENINFEYNFAEVLIDSYTDLENQTFTYSIPQNIKKYVRLGTPVIVPFRDNQLGGYVVDLHNDNALSEDIKIKDIISVSSEQILEQDYINFLKWIAEYYYTNFLSVLKTAIPSGILTKAHKIINLDVDIEIFNDYIEIQKKGEFRDFCEYIKNEKDIKLSKLKAHFGSKASTYVRKLHNAELININLIFGTKGKYKKQLCISYIHSEADLTNREKEVLNIISKYSGYMTLVEVQELASTTPSLIKQLHNKGCIDLSEQIILRKPQKNVISQKTFKLELNEYQKNALDKFLEIYIKEDKNKVILLNGVTGSGKTEVYLQAIENVLNQGKISIMLVPEISLTPQTVNRFRGRFGECIAVLHSRLSEGERFDEWSRIKNGLAKIIIGARSAIFAPCNNIGLIIIDEEHEGSYKQDKNPRYNAKTIAIKRAELNNCPVILGSATPSIESYYEAQNNKNWILVNMPERVENKILPTVKLVDMREEYLRGNRSIFSKYLQYAIEERLKKQEQTIIFINRRGFSTFVMCRDCGHAVRCTDCSVAMVYHATHEALKCHYCGKIQDLPKRCPQCMSVNIRHFGIGTQKIESIAKKCFPSARIARLDKDTTTRKEAHHDILSEFANGDIDILIGTQMIAKGLDFPNVTLVGIIAADTALNLPDFRASEKTFQLITQVAGRAGRGDTHGEVVAQSYSLEHTSIQTAKNHDFESYYSHEIKDREELRYPPFSSLINIIIADTDIMEAKKHSLELSKLLKTYKTDEIISVLGPIPAGIPKIQNYHRFQILIKSKSLDESRNILHKSLKELKKSHNTRIGIDVEPLNLM